MKPYRVVDEEKVLLIDGPFSGILYQYGGVKFEPDHALDQLSLAFSYNILEGQPPVDEAAFHQYIGDILVELIERSVEEKTTVFCSTISEEDKVHAFRDEDSILPDSV